MAALFAVEDDIPELRPGIDVTDLSKPVHVYDIRALDGDKARVSAVAVFRNGLVAIVNENAKCIHIFNSDRQHVRQFSFSDDPSEFTGVRQMQKDQHNNLIFGTFRQHYFYRYNLNGRHLPLFQGKADNNLDYVHMNGAPNGLVVDQKGVVIFSHDSSSLTQFDLSNPWPSAGFHSFNSGNEFSFAGALCLGPDGFLYVANGNSLVALDKNASICKTLRVNYPLWPGCLFVSGNGDIFTTDFSNHRVCVLSPEGELIHSFGRRGYMEGYFFDPVGITLGYDGYLYVADSKNGRVQVF